MLSTLIPRRHVLLAQFETRSSSGIISSTPPPYACWASADTWRPVFVILGANVDGIPTPPPCSAVLVGIDGLWGPHEWTVYPQLHCPVFLYLAWFPLRLSNTTAPQEVLTYSIDKSMWPADPSQSPPSGFPFPFPFPWSSFYIQYTLSHVVPHEQSRLVVWLSRRECSSHYPTLSLTNYHGALSVVSVGPLLPLPFDLAMFTSSLYASPHWSSYRFCQVTV